MAKVFLSVTQCGSCDFRSHYLISHNRAYGVLYQKALPLPNFFAFTCIQLVQTR
jgi:hypothetical protein